MNTLTSTKETHRLVSSANLFAQLQVVMTATDQAIVEARRMSGHAVLTICITDANDWPPHFAGEVSTYVPCLCITSVSIRKHIPYLDSSAATSGEYLLSDSTL